MRKLFSLLFLLSFILLRTPPAVQAVSLAVLPGSQSVLRGTPVAVDLVISGLGDHTAPSLAVFDLDLTFDSAILSLSQVVFGGFLGAPDTDPSPLVSTSVETQIAVDSSIPGMLNLVEISLLEADSATCVFCLPPYLADVQPASFTLATLTFDTLATTTAPSLVHLAVNVLGDANGDPLVLAVTPDASTITVLAPPSGQVPEPATWVCLMTGSLGLLAAGWWQRRRRAMERESGGRP